MAEQSAPDDRSVCLGSLSKPQRRHLLKAMAGGGTIALTGCTGIFSDPAEDIEDPPSPADDDAVDDVDEEPDAVQHEIEYLTYEETIDVPETETLLAAGEDAGFDMPYECRVGVCGQCLSQADGDATGLVEMEANDYEPLDDEAIADGYFLSCTAEPRADFAFETDLYGALEDEDEEVDDEPADVDTFDVEYLTYDETIEVPETETLLEAGEDAGFDMPYQCRVGVCGQCLSQADDDANELVEMETNDYDPLDDEAIADGYFLSCTAEPRADFGFETDLYGEL